MKQDYPVTSTKNLLNSNHSIWIFQPNQVYRLIHLINNHNFRVLANVAGSMADECGMFVDVENEDFTDSLHTLLKYKSPVVTVKIQRHYKRILIIKIDQKGYRLPGVTPFEQDERFPQA